MNERIKQIAEQADIHFYKGRVPETGFEYEGAEVTVEDLKKFVELIIKECSQVINQIDAEDGAVGLYRAESALGKHFGVEL